MKYINSVNSFRVLYECFPRTVRTPLNSPYTPYSPYTPNTPNELIELNLSNLSGFPLRLKKLILTRCNAWRGKQIEPIEPLELLR